MRTNGKCNTSHAPYHRLKRYSAFPNILESPEFEKNNNTISMHGEKFYQLHTETMTAVAISNLSGKTPIWIATKLPSLV